MEGERTLGRPPPVVNRAVLGSAIPVVLVARESELDVVAGQLADGAGQVFGQLVGVGVVMLPGAVALGAIGVDLGDDPPLVTPQQRIVFG